MCSVLFLTCFHLSLHIQTKFEPKQSPFQWVIKRPKHQAADHSLLYFHDPPTIRHRATLITLSLSVTSFFAASLSHPHNYHTRLFISFLSPTVLHDFYTSPPFPSIPPSHFAMGLACGGKKRKHSTRILS